MRELLTCPAVEKENWMHVQGAAAESLSAIAAAQPWPLR